LTAEYGLDSYHPQLP